MCVSCTVFWSRRIVPRNLWIPSPKCLFFNQGSTQNCCQQMSMWFTITGIGNFTTILYRDGSSTNIHTCGNYRGGYDTSTFRITRCYYHVYTKSCWRAATSDDTMLWSDDTPHGTLDGSRDFISWYFNQILLVRIIALVSNGLKLNDFLPSLLKSKLSRLAKKMKHAKLSTKYFYPKTGCVGLPQQAKELSRLERDFINSIPDLVERSEVAFHMSREWR